MGDRIAGPHLKGLRVMNYKFLLHTLISISVSVSISVSWSAEDPLKDSLKESLKKTPVETRTQWLKEAKVFDDSFIKKHLSENASEFSLSEFIKKTCGSSFPYSFSEKENVPWPTVQCTYEQSKRVLGGSTNKFLCNFKEKNKSGEDRVKTRKVKYLAFTGIKNSELVPTLLAGYGAKLMGLPTDLYCPAKIDCENCSSNMPYEFGKGQAAPSADTHTFPDAMVEFSPSLLTVEPNIPRSNPRRAHGVKIEDAFEVFENDSQLVDREAWLLWLNFITESDPIPSNQKLVCRDAELNSQSEIVCKDPMIFTTDYGQSFHQRFQFQNWKKVPALRLAANGQCITGMDLDFFKQIRGWKETKTWLGRPISRSAQQKFLSRIKLITDTQWLDIARFANIQRLYKVSPQEFLTAIRERISAIEKLDCQ